MDCPSRERTGWLCDSLFTSRVAPDLTGTTVVEKAFFENFLLPTRFEHLPDGMLPMCYPADHYDGVFIPNWSLFFVIQLEEYLARSGDQVMVDALRGRIMRLMDYFKRFENEDGLLEKLESWVFVEWSAANQFVQDVNYPSNMLYAAALAATGRMYGDAALSTKAEKIRDVIRHQSFDGQFFVDNAVRKDGKLEVTRNRSEVCQYFAFFFHVASHIVHTLNREILGVYHIDPRNRVVRLRFGDVDLTWCEGPIPLADGALKLRWEKGNNTLRFRLSEPDGYRVQIDNRSDRELVRTK
jgi:alpha-L-rhamnosidase